MLSGGGVIQFVSSISYEAAIMEVHNADALRTAEKFKAYEMEDADDALVNDLASFALTNAIYATLVEGHATEVSIIIRFLRFWAWW